MFDAFISSLVLALGLSSTPAPAGDEIPILANRLVLSDKGKPLELIFDPAEYGSGLQLATRDQSWIPATCEFGSREARHQDQTVSQVIQSTRDKAEAATGRRVARITFCKLEPISVEIHGFTGGEGSVRLPWRSQWGERRAIRMWYSINDDTIMLFSFANES